MVPKMVGVSTYSRRLNAVVTLLAIVLIGNCTIGQEITREQIPSGELKDLHKPETLEERMAEFRWQKNGSPDSGVLRLLEETSDKARPKSILDQFSVNELINMSKYHLSDCMVDKIAARKDDCGRLVGDSQIARLLARYCNNMSREFEAWCGQQKNAIALNALKSNGFTEKMRILVREFKAEMDDKLSWIYREQERTKYNFKKDELHQSVYEGVIEEALKGHDIVKVESIKVVCRKMVDIMSGILQVQEDRTKPNFKARGLLAQYRYCEIVNKLTEKSTGEQ